MTSKTLKTLALATAVSVSLWGCGSNRGSGGDQASLPEGIGAAQTVGVDNCLTCHGGNVGQVWLAGVHGNAAAAPAADLTDPACLACHDQLGDGQRLFAATNGTEANRPVVSCESCHGGGQYHRGVGPVPYVAPDHTRCGQCHNATYPHGSEGQSIAEDFSTSPHTRSINANVLVAGTSDVRARCAKCHTDEGAKLYKDIDGAYADLTAALPNTAAALSGASALSCRTCHQPHNEAALLETASIGRSAEFNTCTNCHQLLVSGSNATIAAYHDPAVNSHGEFGEIITDTHFDDPATGTTAAGTTVEGYVVRGNLDSACSDCHNPHNADNTANRQWARSAHGGHIAEVKEAAEAAGGNVAAAGVTDASGIGWTHYNWDQTTGTGNRASCQRCHTATGLANFLSGPTTYVAANNTFPHLSNWTAAGGSAQQEVLYCWGCHSNSRGGLRDPGAITENYAAVTGGSVVTVTYPDIEGSNICMACHLGRETGDNIKNVTDADGILNFVNSHYLTAGANLFGTSGYEYAGKSYANPTFFAHDKIGLAAAPGTGSNGPCVGCHMSSSEKHLFLPVAVNETTGAITSITSTACAKCHTGESALSAAELTEEKERYEAALTALKATLAAKGIHFGNAYPYFFTAPYVDGGTNTSFTNWGSIYGLAEWKNTMGAAFNFNLLEHDPGGYAHNRFYAKRLIFDAIDYIDNGVLDGTINLTGRPVAAAYLNSASPVTAVARP